MVQLGKNHIRIFVSSSTWRQARCPSLTHLADLFSISYATNTTARQVSLRIAWRPSPKRETTLRRALELTPNDGRARYYSGLSMAQNGRPDVALRLWENLLNEGPENAPWIPLIKDQIIDIARLAGVNLSEDQLPGPNSEQIDSAKNMSDQERMEMIQGMVTSLSNRLATEGGSVNEWARLIRALGVLGETTRDRKSVV